MAAVAQRNDVESKSNEAPGPNAYELKAQIYPQKGKVETTAELAKRLRSPVNSVWHDTNWSGLFDPKILPDYSHWKFDPKAKTPVDHPKDAWTIPLLSPTEAAKCVELCEVRGFEDCGYPKGYRSNTRMITTDPGLSEVLYQRIKACCPPTYECEGAIWEICGLNERFRWCKYVKGQRFGIHCDAVFARSLTEKSFYTVNIYLNCGKTEFEGGRTCFYNPKKGMKGYDMTVGVQASPGLALMFNQYPEQIFHDGEEVTSGVKYLMRTDVMYRKVKMVKKDDGKKGKKGKRGKKGKK